MFYDYSKRDQLDYLSHLGSWDIYPVSGTPRETNNFLTLIKPFDKYTWILLAISVVLVALAIIIIDLGHASWKNVTVKDILHQGKM